MNRESIHQQIESLLKIINDQHDQIKKNTGTIPQVDIDFMVQNLRQLYEAALFLNHSNALSSLDEVKSAVAQKILAEKRAVELRRVEEKKEQPKEEVIPELKPVEKSILPAESELSASVSNDVPATPAPIASEKSSKTRKGGNLNTAMFEDKPTLGDKFGNEERLHVKIASKTSGKTVAERLHKKPIKDLKTAIGINEKFLFINRLFDGNLQTYTVAVEKIDGFSDFESAKNFVTTELANSLNWDQDNGHVKLFMELVERRFIS